MVKLILKGSLQVTKANAPAKAFIEFIAAVLNLFSFISNWKSFITNSLVVTKDIFTALSITGWIILFIESFKTLYNIRTISFLSAIKFLAKIPLASKILLISSKYPICKILFKNSFLLNCCSSWIFIWFVLLILWILLLEPTLFKFSKLLWGYVPEVLRALLLVFIWLILKSCEFLIGILLSRKLLFGNLVKSWIPNLPNNSSISNNKFCLSPGLLWMEFKILKIELSQGFFKLNTFVEIECSNIFDIKGTITLNFPVS